MIYPFSLQQMLLFVGLLLVTSHLLALLKPDPVKAWLCKLPRARGLGALLTIVAAGWFTGVITVMDLGEEFTKLERVFQIAIPTAALLMILFVPELLAARALGSLALLAALPLLDAAFMRDSVFGKFLVVLAYVWVFTGLFWVGMPYLLRDQIAWVTGCPHRWRVAVFAGIAYGALLLVGAVV
jgi:hypothetical protein